LHGTNFVGAGSPRSWRIANLLHRDKMSIINRLANSLGRRDEVPNQELARDLAAKKDKKGIREIAENLWNKDRNCIGQG